MKKMVAVLLMAALTVLAGGIISDVNVQAQASVTPPLMYAGIRG